PEPCIVGRGAHCQVVVADPLVSTSHCELRATDRGVFVRDLGSTNGTTVNGVLLKDGGWVTSNVRLGLGQTFLGVRVAGSELVPLSSAGSFGSLVGRSPAMRRIYDQLEKIAPHDHINVLVTGETGTGKELVAGAIHDASRRRHKSLVVVDCSAIPQSLADSWLFGHEKGAFTGATGRQVSRFAEAEGGTIFFDELGELPIDLQPKLLRVLETRKVQSVGSTQYRPIDVRIVAATRRHMHTEVNAGRFRSDLFYRFAQVIIEIPPLRERPEDIPDLIARFCGELGDPGAVTRIDKPSRERLMRFDWPGNVRELRNVIRVAHAQSNGGPIGFADALNASRMGEGGPSLGPYPLRLNAFELDYFGRLYAETSGNQSEMARRSELPRTSIRDTIKRLKLGPESGGGG
ncbi:MAG: sigma 54-interacting transcriptional regulator, partial [Polyangiaceae bacterium]